MSSRVFTVIIERDPDGGLIGSVAGLPGCFSQGDTMEELRANMVEAIQLYLEDGDAPELDEIPDFVGLERIEVSA